MSMHEEKPPRNIFITHHSKDTFCRPKRSLVELDRHICQPRVATEGILLSDLSRLNFKLLAKIIVEDWKALLEREKNTELQHQLGTKSRKV